MLRPLVASFSILLASTAALAVEPNAPPSPASTSPSTSSPSTSAGTAIEAKSLVQHAFVDPYTKKQAQRSRYSRVPSAPEERRVRVLDATPKTDTSGAHFFRFAVDDKYDDEPNAGWTMNTMSGCAYVETKAVFVKLGSTLRTADALLGKKHVGDPPASACVAADITASAR